MMHEGAVGAKEGWDHNLLGVIKQDPNNAGWLFVPSQSYAMLSSEGISLGRFFSFRFPDWKLIYGPDAPPVLPEFQYFNIAIDPEEANDLFPQIDWATHPWQDVPKALQQWASTQGESKSATIDPRIRAELKALGYVQGGPD